MEARPYQDADQAACLRILRARGFGAWQSEFERHLDPARFFVLEHDGAILGCGGVDPGESTSRLVWGMVDPDWERRGLGRYLLLFRTKQVKTEFLEVEVPESSAGFYEKAGFRRVGSGARGILLSKRLQVCA